MVLKRQKNFVSHCSANSGLDNSQQINLPIINMLSPSEQSGRRCKMKRKIDFLAEAPTAHPRTYPQLN
jgi:hypothetical protein